MSIIFQNLNFLKPELIEMGKTDLTCLQHSPNDIILSIREQCDQGRYIINSETINETGS